MRSKYVPGEKVTEDSSRVLTVPEALEVLEQLKDGVGEVQAFSEHHHLDPTSRQLRRLDRAGEVFDAAKEFVHKRKKRRFF